MVSDSVIFSGAFGICTQDSNIDRFFSNYTTCCNRYKKKNLQTFNTNGTDNRSFCRLGPTRDDEIWNLNFINWRTSSEMKSVLLRLINSNETYSMRYWLKSRFDVKKKNSYTINIIEERKIYYVNNRIRCPSQMFQSCRTKNSFLLVYIFNEKLYQVTSTKARKWNKGRMKNNKCKRDMHTYTFRIIIKYLENLIN